MMLTTGANSSNRRKFESLSETKVRAAKPDPARPYKLTDGRGLYLLVKPTGSKLWRYKFSYNGVEKLLAFGQYPDVSLSRAREKRDEARRLVADGKDPIAERQAAKAARADTFAAVAEEWLEVVRKSLSEKTWQRDRDQLVKKVGPFLGSKPISSIEAPDLLAILRRIEQKGSHDTAHRVRAVVGRVFRFAIATGRARRNIAADLEGALAPKNTQHYAAITDPGQFGELLRAVDGYQGQTVTAAALKIAPYVFVRPGELRAAEWSEFDLDRAEWRIPGKRMKMGAEHLVPLARQIVIILRELRLHTGEGRFLFPSLASFARPMSDNTLNAALRRLGYNTQTDHCAHGFRSTASTLLNEQGFHPDVIELQLAHEESNKVRAAYNRAKRLDERRKMMQAWADYLDDLRKGSLISPIQRTES